MRIALVEPPAPWLVRQHTQAPLGLLYLGAVLRRHGHEAKLFRPLKIEDLESCGEYDVVAFTGTTLDWPMVEQSARWVRQRLPEADVWCGGVHASVMTEEVRATGLFDFVGAGEAEAYIGQIADSWEERPETAWGRVTNLDELPLPDRSLLNGVRGGAVMSFHADGEGSANVITSRGCHYSCAFCGSRTIWGQGVRWRSAANVWVELRNLVDAGCQVIRFEDDNFTSNPKRLSELRPGLRDLGILWHCSARARDLSPGACWLLADGGCRELSVGIESGDQRVLDCLRKRTRIEQIVAGCRNASDAGLHVRALWMIGTPGEHPETPELNRELMETLAAHSHALATFIPLPGTPIWKQPEQFDAEIIDRDFSHYNQALWEQGPEGPRLVEYRPLIRNRLLTSEQQADNVARMRAYVMETGKAHPG